MEYSSQDMCDVADGADSHTIEETILSLMHRDVCLIQIETKRRLEYLSSDEFIERFAESRGERQDLQSLYEAQVQKTTSELLDAEELHIDALHGLAEYRLENYASYS